MSEIFELVRTNEGLQDSISLTSVDPPEAFKTGSYKIASRQDPFANLDDGIFVIGKDSPGPLLFPLATSSYEKLGVHSCYHLSIYCPSRMRSFSYVGRNCLEILLNPLFPCITLF